MTYQKKRHSSVPTKKMQPTDAVVMTTIGTSIRTIDTSIARFQRSRTNDVLKAYAHIVSLAGISTPGDHVSCIHSLAQGQGVAVVPRTDVEHLRNLMELGDYRQTCIRLDVERFDPNMHALLCTEPTVVSYMEDNPDNILGTCATVVAPTFKSALVWWTCE
jgi:hypothetical protein